jgi:predicted house-cleaning noncanonical NTP pyrophosphatase (MazG superfamily)
MAAQGHLEKLVRHHLPDQLRARGEKIETRIAKPEEMLKLLRNKLVEEVEELVEAIDSGNEQQIIEELADVREVVDTFELVQLAKSVEHTLARIKRQKYEQRGGFAAGIVMRLDAPVPSILQCPKCNTQHVDKGVWATTRIHRTHLCANCGHLWRPYAYATVGVSTLPVEAPP